MRPNPKEMQAAPIKYPNNPNVMSNYGQPMDMGPTAPQQPSIDLPEMVNQIKNMISTFKKMPSKKQKKFRCPAYGCLNSFNRFEELEAHIPQKHAWLAHRSLKPLPDGRFEIPVAMLKLAYEYFYLIIYKNSYLKKNPNDAATAIADMEKDIQPKKNA